MPFKENSRLQPINNLEKVALDLKNYILNMDNKENIYQALSQVEKDYNAPRNTWVMGWIYSASRKRGSDIAEIKEKVKLAEDPIIILALLVVFFQNGAWEVTSANTLLISLLANYLTQYNWKDEKTALLWPDPQINRRLCDLFLQTARPLIASYKKVRLDEQQEKILQAKLKLERQDELNTLPQKIIKKRQEEINAQVNNTERFRSYDRTRVKKLNDDQDYQRKALLVSNSLKKNINVLTKSIIVKSTPGRLSENNTFRTVLGSLDTFFKGKEKAVTSHLVTKPRSLPKCQK